MTANYTRDARGFTPVLEQRLIRAAQAGDRIAEAHLLGRYERMVRRLTFTLYLPGGDREDLEQEARVAVVAAIRTWNAAPGVPFRIYAWLCASRGLARAIGAAHAAKHQPLTRAMSLNATIRIDTILPEDSLDSLWLPLEQALAATGRADDDPVAKTLGRERLRVILERAPSLSPLERSALALSATGHTHRESARRLGVGERAINNSLQRARRKLLVAL